MGRKSQSVAHYQIDNIPNEEQFLIIYNHVIDGMYLLERVFKKNHKIRKFDISEIWEYEFKNGIAEFDRLKKLKNLNHFLETDLHNVFRYAHISWLNKRKPLEDLEKISFWCKCKDPLEFSGFYLAVENGKWIWYENAFPCYTKNRYGPFED